MAVIAGGRLPSLQEQKPREKVLRQLELRELQVEVKELQHESNRLRGEAVDKQAQFRAILEGVNQENLSSPSRQIATPAYLQVIYLPLMLFCWFIGSLVSLVQVDMWVLYSKIRNI
jgi:hypothetical protein